jgi:very-short-patch-repair endonuclease
VDLYNDARAYPEQLRGYATVVPAAELASHGLTPASARWRSDHGRIDRAHHGTYLLGGTDLLDRCRAALVQCHPGAVIGFQTAAALHGFGVVEDARIHVVVPCGSNFPWRPGIRVHQSVLPVAEPMLWSGTPCTPPARTAIDLARVLPRPQALSTMDAALFAKASDADALAAEVLRHRGLAGARRARELVGLADGRAECAQESHLRLLLHDAALLTSFVPQYPVLDDGGEYVRYRLDLADPEHKVAAEYDGASHLGRPSVRRDRRRHNWLDERGWLMRYFTDAELYHDPGAIVRTLRHAIARRRHGPAILGLSR